MENITIEQLKERIKNLKTNQFTYRCDINQIISQEKKGSNLVFDIWEKTAGEQWGNCRGNKISIKLGNKFIKCEAIYYNTNFPDSKLKEKILTNEKLNQIITLIENSEKEEHYIDKEEFLKQAINKVYDIYND